jgi:hypothetical protein
MAITFYVLGNLESSHKRRVFEEKNAVGVSAPLFLASVYDGETIQLSCLVTGATYAETKTYIDNTLVPLFKANEEITIGPAGDIVPYNFNKDNFSITGKITLLSYSLRPGSKTQRVAIDMNAGYTP